MSTLLQDLRFALRTLVKRPGFASVAILTLALGISACTIVFSTVYGLLYRPLPFDPENRLVLVRGSYTGLGWFDAHSSYPNYLDLKEQAGTLEELAAFEVRSLNFTEGAEPQPVTAIRATGNLFDTLGVRPTIGRLFGADEDRSGADGVVVLSEHFWSSSLGADPDIVGRKLTFHDDDYTVIGVLPIEFDEYGNLCDIWLPLAASVETTERRDNNLNLIGRRKPGVSVAQVNTEFQTLQSRLVQAYPRDNEGRTVGVTTIRQKRIGDDRALAIRSLTAAVGLVLLIACSNVANLMLARATARGKELALRAALGAGRGRIVRQLLTESAVVALVAGVLGAGLAFWGVDLLTKTLPEYSVRHAPIRVDGLALAFTLAVSMITTLLVGLLPALRASRCDVMGTLKEGNRTGRDGSGRNRLRGALVVGEIALAVVLVTAGGLVIRSFLNMQRADLGFNPDGVLTARLALPDYAYPETHQQAGFYSTLLTELKGLPEITSATAADAPPLFFSSWAVFAVEGRPAATSEEEAFIGFTTVTPGYWKTMRIPLATGRTFDDRDTADSSPVVVINKTTARRHWPNEEAVGKRLKLSTYDDPDTPWRTVIGVVADTLQGVRSQSRTELFLPHAQAPRPTMVILMRTVASDPASLAAAVRAAVRRVDPRQPVVGITTMHERIDRLLSPWKVYAGVLATFAAVALTLAAIGVYTVMSYMVSQRTHEIGVRMALGAQVRHILRLVVGQAAGLTALGLVLGVSGALAATRLLGNLLYGVGTTDLPTFVAVPLLLTVVALLACYVPARRATKVDPMVALRCE